MLGKILLAVTLVQAPANQTFGTIRGQIVIPLVSASERIPVTIQRADGPLIGRIFTDTLGNFEARGVPAGSYEVIVNVEGFEEVRQGVAVGAGNFNTVVLNITLREKEKVIVVKPDGGAADDIVDINELGRKYPRKAIQDYEKAREEMRKGNTSKAIELLQSVVKLAPDYYTAHNTLGTLYQKAGRMNEAETEYRKARELNPRNAEPLVNLGSLFIDQAAARVPEGKEIVGKILDDALDILEASLKIQRTPMGYYFLGTAYYKSDFYEEAEDNLQHAMEMDPKLAAGHLMLANLYIKQKKWPDALTHLDAYLNENPKASDRLEIQDTRSKVAQRVK
jgi:Tfp pilus assembly protein PilF